MAEKATYIIDQRKVTTDGWLVIHLVECSSMQVSLGSAAACPKSQSRRDPAPARPVQLTNRTYLSQSCRRIRRATTTHRPCVSVVCVCARVLD